ncbi:TIGR03620 family F420-dependent LLM class oxidoreductase [Umezawaea sp. Da 62-37]|uniref:TIGR03620 family F420-dependent LLM class oxidoreductase n=1 Tax=Umezawaea sp. Da 62-37 TaxID=3075927 RepID=UPI0028F728FB|nr:TIGR03620 family F420-dependent LLM class oxidoreductase [Umezawaea sp. Da 62-37]WNV83983.1 TIGR03620 family F420-dependent LLM class oxidoreductase [Umezawaea sp. Da 62-37]
MTIALGELGVHLHYQTATPELAVEIEKAGYGAMWLIGAPPADLDVVEQVLDATERLVVATCIVNIWTAPAKIVAESCHRIAAKHPDRFLLGLGAGRRAPDSGYMLPYDAHVEYLDELAAAGVPADQVALAVLGPRALRLAAERTAGVAAVLVTPAHAQRTRQIVGEDALVMVGQHVVLDTDAERARTIGRAAVAFPALNVPEIANNLRRAGFTVEDLTDQGSDRLIDALVLHGEVGAIASGLVEHLDAGADHVGVTVLGDDVLGGLRAVAGAVAELRR